MSKHKRFKKISTLKIFGSLHYVSCRLDKGGDCKRLGRFERKLMNELISSLGVLFEVHCLWINMSNKTVEMLLFIPSGRLTEAEATLRSMEFYKDKPRKHIFRAEQLTDLSCYMHYLLRVFSMRWGKEHGFPPRYGRVWCRKHFKSKIIDSGIIGRILTKVDTKEIIHKLRELKVTIPLETYTGPLYMGANSCGRREFVLEHGFDGRRRGCVRMDSLRGESWETRCENVYDEYDRPSNFVEGANMAWENITTSPSCRGAAEIQLFLTPVMFGLYMADGCYRWWKRRKAKAQKKSAQTATEENTVADCSLNN